MEETEKYNKFVQGYIALCKETGFYFDITHGNEIGVYIVAQNREYFEAQANHLKEG